TRARTTRLTRLVLFASTRCACARARQRWRRPRKRSRMQAMKFAAALSTKTDSVDLVEELSHQTRAHFGSEKTDLALLFVHPQFIPQIGELLEGVRGATGARHLTGCTGSGII